MHIRFSIYLATRERWAFLQKDVSMEAVPRVGEWVKFKNQQMGFTAREI